jgi:FkbM family methyltransferase
MITHIDGWWWPAIDQHARGVILRDCAAAVSRIAQLAPKHDVIVQAGANVGVYPVALADRFQKVITFEPDPTNWDCLDRNLKARDSLGRIMPFRAALGAAEGWCMPAVVEVANCGAHRVDYRPEGLVSVVTIDSLPLEACDVIWLDIEGPELFALQGAESTIRRFSPLIAFEDKGLGEAFQIPHGAADRFVRDLGYSFVERQGNDSIYRRTR